MAEASCSGGTPFKRLIDHQSSGAHHQDRLVDRTGVAGNTSFRSSPSHNNQSQNGFGAFVRGGANSSLPSFSHDPAGRLAAHASSLQPVQALPPRTSPVADLSSNWAADFSRFSAQQQHQQQQQQNQMMMMHSQPPASHLNMQSAFVQPSSHQTSFGSAFGMGMGAGMNMANGAFMAPPPPPGMAQQQQQQQPGGQSDFDREMSRWMSVHGGGNMQEVDAMMDQMAREIEQQEQSAAQAAEAEKEGTRVSDLETPEIGNLSLLETESKGETTGDLAAQLAATEHDTLHVPAVNINNNNILHNEDVNNEVENETHTNSNRSAVAEAAEKLLDCVNHEGGEKWQNSVFLSLMRDFRDGRKDIVGDEIITAGGEESSSASPELQPQLQQEQQQQQAQA